MTAPSTGPGCRDATIATGFLVLFAAVLFGAGLTLVNGDTCSGLCETAGLAILYAGGPVSGLFGVSTDSIVIAWPLDITLWVVLGFWAARRAAQRSTPVLAIAVFILVIALTYGLVLSQFVELVE